MKLSIRTILAASAITLAAGASAQTSRAGYFLDNYTYRFQLNPAYGNDRGFFAMPALGNMGLGVSGTLGVDDVLYNVNGRTTTFLNPLVPASEVMGNIGDKNRFDFDSRITLLAFGFKGMGGYNTFSLGTRASVDMSLPGSLFSLLKEGVSNKTYSITDLRMAGNAYVELSLGHSHQIFDGLRIGANAKVLFGAANAKFNLERADLTLGQNDWNIQTMGEAYVNMKGFRFQTELSENTGRYYVNDVDVKDPGLGGVGFAIDLGATYVNRHVPILRDFEFSVSLLDLGFINWNNHMVASTEGLRSFNTDRYTFNVDDDAVNSFSNEWDVIKKDLCNLYELTDMGDQGSMKHSLGATLNIGALYTLPCYKGLKFGLLNTTRMQGDFSWTEFSLSANIVPCKVFDAAVNLNTGTFGTNLGWLINLHCPGFNLFFGMDRTPLKLAKQGVPLNANGHFNLGINFLL